METSKTRKSLRCKVVRHLPLGLLMELEDGRSGIVRVREISWDAHERSNWRSLYPLNWSGLAVPLDQPETGGHIDLSLRLTQNDPWERINELAYKGQEVEGAISGVLAYGAFVELNSGLTGLLHRSSLPEWVPKNKDPLDLFWPGDRVRVILREIDPVRRRISLSLAHRGGQERAVAPAPSVSGTRRRSSLDSFLLEEHPKKHILVIDDNHDQSGVVTAWLKHVGQRVDSADSGCQGLELLKNDPADIVFIDLGLPDMNGLEVVQRLLDEGTSTQFILVTDWASANEHMQALETLQAAGVGLLIRPLLPEDLLDVLLQKPHPAAAPVEAPPALRKDFSLLDVSRLPAQRAIQALLSQCHETIGFEAVILFALDPGQRSIEMVQKSGDGLARKEALAGLIYSPVRDVAEDGEVISIERLGREQHDRFRYLLEYYPLEACIAVPVRGNFKRTYALVALDSRPRRIPPEANTYMGATSLAITSILERVAFQEQATSIQRSALLGHVSSAMVHETNNIAGRLNIQLENVEDCLEAALAGQPPGLAQAQQVNLARAELQEVQNHVDTIIQSMRMFARIIIKSKTEMLRIDEIIQEVVHLLKKQSDDNHVAVQFIPPPKMAIVRTQAAALEQILLNLLLNAIQQINEWNPQRGGWVKIGMETSGGTDKNAVLRICIEDNGPGIHYRLWETVFEAGYTTRPDGSGIGLYISRSLIEALGGKIYIINSCVLGGTIFAIDLPYLL